MRTSILSAVAKVELKPRLVMPQVLPFCWATCRETLRRRASGRLVTPERRRSSPVITAMAAAAFESCSLRRDTDVTSISMSCSILSCLSSAGATRASSWTGPARAGAARAISRTPGQDLPFLQTPGKKFMENLSLPAAAWYFSVARIYGHTLVCTGRARGALTNAGGDEGASAGPRATVDPLPPAAAGGPPDRPAW